MLAVVRTGLPGMFVRLGVSASRVAFVTRLLPLLVVLLGTLAVVALDHRQGVAVVGSVVEGLPGFAFFLPAYDTVRNLIVAASVFIYWVESRGRSGTFATAV